MKPKEAFTLGMGYKLATEKTQTQKPEKIPEKCPKCGNRTYIYDDFLKALICKKCRSFICNFEI